ncbi:MAG: SurA N-terminal domain-containing protein [Patescibacteria group bacterium]
MENNIIQTEPLNIEENQQKADKKSIKIKINIKIAIIIAVIIAVGALVYIYRGLFIAVTVDGSPISRLTVIRNLEKASGKSLLDSLITEKLIQNEANKKGIIVSNDELNARITIIQDQIVAQGSTLDAALVTRNMTMEDLRKQIALQIEVEKLVADKINITDEEVAQYIKDYAVSIPKGQEATIVAKIKDDLKNQKMSAEADSLITSLRSQANIRYFVNY